MSERADAGAVVVNGIDGDTFDYFTPPLDLAGLAALLERESGEALAPSDRRRPLEHPMGPKEGVDPRRLDEAGWAVVFPAAGDPAVREALAPLLRHRRTEAGRRRARRYRELAGGDGYRPAESKPRFLARHGVGPGPVDPDRLPYYVLLVGGPDEIPYAFQYQLDVQYAVGRLSFDRADDYARYAESVVRAERGGFARSRRAALFGVREDGDPSTERSHDLLVAPLARRLAREVDGWSLIRACGADATKERLGRLLGAADGPGLLLTAGHGLAYRRRDERQRARQGALVCQGWDRGRPPWEPQPVFSGDDLAPDASLEGLVAFLFACFSGGTPARNDFAHRDDGAPDANADGPFVAHLPRRMLAHPGGGALAVVGHVDRAWTYSFDWPLAGAQVEVFASALKRLVAGHPLGSAMEVFNQRYAELECDLAALRARLALGGRRDFLAEGQTLTARNDARNFLVLGDPAVRLAPPPAGNGAR